MMLRAPSVWNSPDLSKRRTPSANTASRGSMPASLSWISASPSVSASASRTETDTSCTAARKLSMAAGKRRLPSFP